MRTLVRATRTRSAIPECFRNEKEEDEETSTNNNCDDPKHPTPSHTADNSSADKRHEVFATEKEKSVDANTVCSLMEEVDFSNSGRGKTLDSTNGDPLENPSNHQTGVIWRQGTPHSRKDKECSP
jgi:hypothetical protein